MKARGIKQQKNTGGAVILIKGQSSWSPGARAAVPTFLDIPVDKAPSQPMPGAWEEGRERGNPPRHHTSSAGGKEATWILGNRQSHTRVTQVTQPLLTAAHDAGL